MHINVQSVCYNMYGLIFIKMWVHEGPENMSEWYYTDAILSLLLVLFFKSPF